MIHEDDRRTLEIWPEAKVITAKNDCELGGHFHKRKTEVFMLVSGECEAQISGLRHQLQAGQLLTVEPLAVHTFHLKKGTVLLCLCSQPYDKNDEYKPHSNETE